MHFQGDGVVQDLGIAAKYFKIGAELGNATAANNASSGAHAQTHTAVILRGGGGEEMRGGW